MRPLSYRQWYHSSGTFSVCLEGRKRQVRKLMKRHSYLRQWPSGTHHLALAGVAISHLFHANAQHLQLAVQMASFYPDLLGGFGDVAFIFLQFR